MNTRVVISGCSGGGKSTVIDLLAERGFATIPEPGRRVVRDEMAHGGSALPWRNMAAFARRALDLARADYADATGAQDWVFFDRSMIDAAVALENAGGPVMLAGLAASFPYHPLMFMAPPWPEIYVRDAERPTEFEAAHDEYERLARAYPALGYQVVELPRASPSVRADLILATLASQTPDGRG